ncbi:MAG: (Fe-S)-binding protein [Micromonosporaceae bacterium]
MEDLRELASECVHCGFCLPACPTYQLWGEEMDSPRGRIHLMTQVMEGAPLEGAVVEHLDRCLGCMACVTACPSGVKYDRLIESVRAWPLNHPRSARERAVRAAIFAVFPYPRRLRAVAAPLRAAQKAGLDRLVNQPAIIKRLPPALAAALRLAPPPARRIRLPERVPARGPRRAVVGMVTGCVQSEFFPQVNAATARLLAAEGCDVIIPRAQGCCGALSLHTGRADEAASLAGHMAEVFGRSGVDAVVVNAAGCGSAMKDYGTLLEGRFAAVPGARLAGKVRDLAEFLSELGPVAPRQRLPITVVYHDACHLAHAQRMYEQPRALLSAIPGLELMEIPDSGTCCGSAGVYNLLQPEAARELGERKAEAVTRARAAGAGLLVSANPGCTLQIGAALAERGEPMPVAHTAEVLDASVRGLPPSTLTRR